MSDILDLFAPDNSHEIHKGHVINVFTVMIVLLEKGVVTEQELNSARMRATHLIDQKVTEQQKQAEKEFDEKHPGVRELFSSLFGGIK